MDGEYKFLLDARNSVDFAHPNFQTNIVVLPQDQSELLFINCELRLIVFLQLMPLLDLKIVFFVACFFLEEKKLLMTAHCNISCNSSLAKQRFSVTILFKNFPSYSRQINTLDPNLRYTLRSV